MNRSRSHVPGLQILGQLLAPHRGIDGMGVADGRAPSLDDAAQRVLGVEGDVDLGLGGRARAPPGLDVRPRQPAADQIPVGAAAPGADGRRRRQPCSMPEVAHAGEDHGEALVVGSGDHFLVAHRSARLDDGGGAGLGGRQQPIGERKEGVRGNDGAARQRLARSPTRCAASAAFSAAMRAESTRLIWPAPMPTVAPSLA